MMRTISLVLIVFTIDACPADVLVLTDQPERKIYGRWIDSNDTKVTFDERISVSTAEATQPTFQRLEVDRHRIKVLVRNIDESRLQSLSLGDLKSYRDYAEELVPQKADLEARELAIRLLLICAYWAPLTNEGLNLKHSALRNLQTLARDADEADKFKRLLDLENRVRRFAAESRPTAPEIFPGRNQRVMKIVQAIRRGDFRTAQTELESPEADEDWKAWKEILDRERLLQITKSQNVNQHDLRILLAIEIGILEGKATPEISVSMAEPDWEVEAKSMPIPDDYFPSLETATEFDPREAAFRDGKWQIPNDQIPTG